MKKSALIIFINFIAACASGPKGPQPLVLKAPTSAEYTAYRSNSSSVEYYENQVVREKSESVDFVVETKAADVKTAESQDQRVGIIQTTVAKDGSVALHDFGFPELKEAIEFHYTGDARVLKAGEFHPQSLFFVPPLPLPARAVEEGDTWQLEHSWVSASGIELMLDVVGIHKGFKNCGESSPCVRMEISGSVKPASDRIVGMELLSQISGELLFSISMGGVYSSEVRSTEKLEFPNRKIESKSCMVSVPVKNTNLKEARFPKCEL